MALLLAGSALGIAGCAQQRTEGYYDPPAESTVTDAQSQGSGAGYRTVLRAPSQVQIALQPDASRKTASQQAQAAQAIPPRTASPCRRGADSGAASGVAASGAAPAPAVPASTPSAAAHGLVPQPADLHGHAALLLARHAARARRGTLALARRVTWKATPSRARRWSNKAAGTPPTNARRAVILLDWTARAACAPNSPPPPTMCCVRSIAGQTPNLNYNLTRQPDLDPIDELAQGRRAAVPLRRRRQRLNAAGSYPGCPAATRQARLLAGLRVPDLATRARTGPGRGAAGRNRARTRTRRIGCSGGGGRTGSASANRGRVGMPQQRRRSRAPVLAQPARQLHGVADAEFLGMWARWASAVRSECQVDGDDLVGAAGGRRGRFRVREGQRSEQGIEIGA